jgi:ankyrin repeat protein
MGELYIYASNRSLIELFESELVSTKALESFLKSHQLTKSQITKMVEETDSRGMTALHYAAESFVSGNKPALAVIEKLIQLGSKPMAIDEFGRTLMHILVEATNQVIAEPLLGYLIEHYPTNIVTKNKRGFNPIHIAARLGHDRFLEILMNAAGKKINQRGMTGDTPLSLAITFNRYHTILLVLASKDLVITDDDLSKLLAIVKVAPNQYKMSLDIAISNILMPTRNQLAEVISFSEYKKSH